MLLHALHQPPHARQIGTDEGLQGELNRQYLREDIHMKRSIPSYSTLLEHEIMTWILFPLMLFARKGHDIHDTDHRH